MFWNYVNGDGLLATHRLVQPHSLKYMKPYVSLRRSHGILLIL